MEMKTIFILVVIVLISIFLFPKKSGVGPGGPLREGATIITSQSKCLGYQYTCFGSNRFRCSNITSVDGGGTDYCIGIPYPKKCYRTKLSVDVTTEEITCSK